MENRDELEQFIKREVDQIQFDGADEMWNDFQPQLPTAEPPNGNFGKWIGKGLWIVGLGAALTYVFPTETNQLYNSIVTPTSNQEAQTTAETEVHTDIVPLDEIKEYKVTINFEDAGSHGSSIMSTEGTLPVLIGFVARYLNGVKWKNFRTIQIALENEKKEIEIIHTLTEKNKFQIITNNNGVKTETILYDLSKDQLQKIIEDWPKK